MGSQPQMSSGWPRTFLPRFLMGSTVGMRLLLVPVSHFRELHGRLRLLVQRLSPRNVIAEERGDGSAHGANNPPLIGLKRMDHPVVGSWRALVSGVRRAK